MESRISRECDYLARERMSENACLNNQAIAERLDDN
jgi:hypothetical protein